MRGARSRARFAFTLGLALACPSFALNPALDISQYSHKAWKVSEGFTKSGIYTVAQTPDGYLWLGTDFGLVRFDGVRAVEWTPPDDQQLPSNTIRRLLVTRDGTLWIGTFRGLASWKDGRLTAYKELAGLIVDALLEDHEGTVWAGGGGRPPGGALCAIRKGVVQCHQEGLGAGVTSLYEFGELWAGTVTGLWRWKPDPPRLYPMPDRGSIQDLIEGDNGTLWMATAGGMRQLKNGKIEAHPLPGYGQFYPFRLLRDREGGLWIGASGQGILHLHHGRADVFTSADGLSGETVRGLLEDREGNIWVATSDGLDRFRDFAVPTISVKQGLSGIASSVLVARDGSVWMGGTGGLNRWNNGQITIYRKRGGSSLARLAEHGGVREKDGLPENSVQSVFQDDRGRIWVPMAGGFVYMEDDRSSSVDGLPSPYVYAMAEDGAGSLWLGEQFSGLLHLIDGKLVEQIPWNRLGHRDYVDALVSDRRQGGLWLGFVQGGGVAFFKDGQIRASYSTVNGLGQGRVYDLRFDDDGSLWAATDGGLSRFKNGRIDTLTRKNGLPCDAVHATIEDDDHFVWLRLACGLMRAAHSELDAWAADSNRTIQATVFDSFDSVRDRAVVYTPKPVAAKSADGKLWFITEGGVNVIDPRHLPFNKLRPPVQIEKVIADRKTYAAGAKPPALVRDVEIDYTALSFVAPEKVRFRYKLDGRDLNWVDAGNRRQAFYDDFPPRNYRFRVMAANNDGVWNETGASFNFSVAPAYYQTTWFAVLVGAAVLALLTGLHRLRLLYVTKQFNARLEGRVSERIRVARDLHDTLLQSFQGTLLKFHSLSYLLTDHPQASKTLESCIEQARAAITEGRDAVQGLRSSTMVMNDLARAIGTFGQALAADHAGANCPEFVVQVEGKSRDLPPLVRDEVYRIACECLRNGFAHARAKRIEVQIRYDQRRFWLQIGDNGKGIDPAVLKAGGRTGHHGLPGMRERAELAGGKLSVWSQVGSGTEIELSIPGAVAYAKAKAAGAGATDGGKDAGVRL